MGNSSATHTKEIRYHTVLCGLRTPERVVDTAHVPKPRMEYFMDSMGEIKVFSTLQALWGYYEVPIAEGGRDKTTLTSHRGTYRYSCIPFRLSNAPEILQRALDIILSGFRWRICLVFMYDVIMSSKDEK